jgi:glycosyltransferase involved in cell wall biosynthesis
MRIGLVGVRGIPALYSGFETAATEICTRLAARGHHVTVYCRRGYGDESEATYQGVHKRYLPSLPISIGETLSHSLLALIDTLRDPPDVLIVFNPANMPLLVLPHFSGIPYAVNVDGLEWRRTKWPLIGRGYFYFACWLSARMAPWIIADSRAIQRLYKDRWGADSTFATYGTGLTWSQRPELLQKYDLTPGSYFVVVARLEPENNTNLITEAFAEVATDKQLIIVGGTRYRSAYVEALKRETTDPRIRFLGGIYDQEELNEILCNTFAYVHGHMVGGTNPVLLQALGAGSCVLYLDHEYGFNGEVVAEAGIAFRRDVADLRNRMQALVDDPASAEPFRAMARERVRTEYSWDTVADQYEDLCERMLRDHRGARRPRGGLLASGGTDRAGKS